MLRDPAKEQQLAQQRARQKAWRAKNPDKIRAYNERQRDYRYQWGVQKQYGLTPGQYDDMFTRQGGICVICRDDERSAAGRLVVDHDHSTGAVRGLLCRQCNAGIGMLQDRAETLAAAVAYLRSA